MAGQQVSRLRRAALTGVLTPVLILGAAGLGALPGGILPTAVTAQSVIDGGACAAFVAPARSVTPQTVIPSSRSDLVLDSSSMRMGTSSPTPMSLRVLMS